MRHRRRIAKRGWDKWEQLKRAIGAEKALLELIGWVGEHETRENFEFIGRMWDVPVDVGSRDRSGDLLDEFERYMRIEQIADEFAQALSSQDLEDGVEDAARMWDIRLSNRHFKTPRTSHTSSDHRRVARRNRFFRRHDRS